MPRALGLVALSPFVSRLPRLHTLRQAEDRLAVSKELIEAGKLTPVIDRTHPPGEVPEAIRSPDEGRAQEKGRHDRVRH